MQKKRMLLSGNQAIAQAAYINNVLFAAGYPGTPSTEILEETAKFKNIQAQWAPNEKVALDTAVGASLGGTRALVAMKHVGLNVASDTLMTLSYTGVNAGLVIITADDPGMNSSQNEQDNRNYAKFAKIPLLEPGDSQEAHDFLAKAFEISENFDTPVLIRITAKVAHGKSVARVPTKRKRSSSRKSLKILPDKYAMVPIHARRRRLIVEKKISRLKSLSEKIYLNRTEKGSKKIGIITSGISYFYAKEALPNASFLKLGMSFPVPEKLIKDFSRSVSNLYVIEELDPFLEDQINAMGIKTHGKDILPSFGELSPGLIKDGLKNNKPVIFDLTSKRIKEDNPFLCAGCAYLGLFYILKKLKLTVIGDIGCYSLMALKPFSILRTCISMGSAPAIANGLIKASKKKGQQKVITVIGDSTFIHSGIPPLIDTVYNKTNNTVIIFNNGTTAMTGGQDHPGSGRTLKKEKTHNLNYKKLAQSLGIKSIKKINCYDLNNCEKIIKDETCRNEPSLIIARNGCLLNVQNKKNRSTYIVDKKFCNACKKCTSIGCPAIKMKGNKPVIDIKLCNGCALCKQVCPKGAIKKIEE